MMCILLELLIIALVKHLKLLLNSGPFATTNCARARMLLLLFHLFQDRFLFNLQQSLAIIFAQAEPEVFDILTFLLRTRVPDIVVTMTVLVGNRATKA